MINYFENMGGIANLMFVVAAMFIAPGAQFLFNLDTFANLFYVRKIPHPNSKAAKNEIIAAFQKLNKNNYFAFKFGFCEKINLYLALTCFKPCVCRCCCRRCDRNIRIYEKAEEKFGLDLDFAIIVKRLRDQVSINDKLYGKY